MINLVVFGIVAGILGVAIAYIVKSKRAGQKCIGCPAGKNCGGNCGRSSDGILR